MHPDSTQIVMDTRLESTRIDSSVVDVDKWSADDCRVYLRSVVNRGDVAAWQVADLVSRVRARLAALQLAELWPVDPRD